MPASQADSTFGSRWFFVILARINRRKPTSFVRNWSQIGHSSRGRRASTKPGKAALYLASMSIRIPPELENKLRVRAQEEGLTIEDYLERLISADERAEQELTALALEGIESG